MAFRRKLADFTCHPLLGQADAAPSMAIAPPRCVAALIRRAGILPSCATSSPYRSDAFGTCFIRSFAFARACGTQIMSVSIGTGINRVHPDFAATAVDRCRLGHAPQRPFGRGIGEGPGEPLRPATDEIFTMDPPPERSIAGTTAFAEEAAVLVDLDVPLPERVVGLHQRGRLGRFRLEGLTEKT